ncbi:LysR family transcriptional regulator [Variovorax sp. 770b2]|uniref:LysR family transcriptional regulator n=1 Tax=Variovorax sp. 770b2 TaxID=1566271 RepID=UPI0008F05A46|nr:LysR family transcriptional regulator [Variovorax sp. 770b2]SFQ36841.1 DNA-binding transcriptional regulator, LysR family [Variovorax sp. 770b2]
MINFRLLKHLYLFSVVAEELHFRRAAARLGMSQPPLTEQIQVLEAALKVKLFDRSGKGVQLTAEGAAILPAVKKLVFQMDRVEVAVQESLRGRGRMVTIGAITTAMASPLPAVIEQLKAEVPDASISVIEIDSAEALVALDEGVIDVAFARIESGAGHAIHAHPLRTERLGVALPRWHRLAARDAIAMRELADEEFIMFPRAVSPTFFDGIISACRSHGFTPRILHESRSVTSQIAMVGCSQGVALVPLGMQHLGGELVAIKALKEQVDIVTIAVAWSARTQDPMVERIVAIASSMGAGDGSGAPAA